MKTDADDFSDEQKQRAAPQPVKLHKAVSTNAIKRLLVFMLLVVGAILVIVVAAALALGSFAP